MKIQYLLVLLLLLGLLTACAGTTTTNASAEPIKIGGVFDLTGAEAPIDLPAANGVKLAVNEINAAGGLLGRPVEFVLRDGKYERDVTTQAAKQLVEEDKVQAALVPLDTDSVLAAGKVIQAAGLPFITPGATSPKIPEQVGDKVFLACFGDNVQAAAAAEFAFKKFGKTSYLIWDDGIEYTTLLARYFNQSFTELGGTVVGLDSFKDDAKDFAAQIEKLKTLPQQPDFYFIAGMPYNAGLIIKQFREAGLTAPIVGGDGYDTPQIVTDAGVEAAENVYFTTHALMDPAGATAGIKKFSAAYKAEFDHEPENVFATLGYDAMNLLADAIKRAGSTDPQAIQKALEETKDFPALTGPITLSAQSHIPDKGVTMIAVKGGKFTLAEEIVPQAVAMP